MFGTLVSMLATQDVQPSVDGAEEAAELKQIFRQVDLLLLQASGVAARFAAKPYYEEEGFASPIEWIRFECHQTSTAAADVIAVGENLERLSQTVQAVRAGEIGFPHLKTMARTANFIGGGFDEIKLLPKARDNSAGKFYYICDHYRHSLDPKAYEAEQTERVENRKLTITTCDDGAVLIKGVFDPEGGAALRTAWEPLARRSGVHDDRSRQKRLADAAVELAVHAMDQRSDSAAGYAAHPPAGHCPARDAAPVAWRARCGPGVLAAAHLRQDGGAAGLRRLGDPHRARLGVHGHRCRAGQADDLRSGAESAQRTRSRVHLAGLRAAGEL